MIVAIPPGLEPWSLALSALDDEIATSLGPLVRHLDQLVSRYDTGIGHHGELDGFGGITNRGQPQDLLISQWALAETHPTEFLRRAVSSELLYLQPAYQQDQNRGSFAVLVDAGLEQIGACRLAQLAALIVLHRRASARGADLILGVLGDEAGSWRTGEFEQLLRGWLSARRATAGDANDIERWVSAVERSDEVWLMCGRDLSAQLPGLRRKLTSWEAAWDQSGATAVGIELDGTRVELALPRRELAIRALRGLGFRQRSAADKPTVATGRLRFPFFPSTASRLMARGDGPHELVAITIDRDQPLPRPKRYQFPGTVLAASFIGQRVVAVVARDGMLRVRSIGKTLGHIDRIEVPMHTVGIDDARCDHLSETGLSALYFDSGDILFPVEEEYFRLSPKTGGTAHAVDLAGIGASGTPDQPHIAYRDTRTTIDTNNQGPQWMPMDAKVVFGPRPSSAWSRDGIEWHQQPELESQPFTISAGGAVLGIVNRKGRPALIEVSSGGRIVRMHFERPHSGNGVSVLTAFSGGNSRPRMHPAQPLIAVQRDDGGVDIGDVLTGERVLSIPGGS